MVEAPLATTTPPPASPLPPNVSKSTTLSAAGEGVPPGNDFGSESYFVTGSEFVVVCGCDGVEDDDAGVAATPAPATPAANPTPTSSAPDAPTAAPASRDLTTPAPADSPSSSAVAPSSPTPASSSCAVGSGVTVTSSEFPLLEGCLEEVDIYNNDGFEYLSATGIIVTVVPEDNDTVSVNNIGGGFLAFFLAFFECLPLCIFLL